MKRRVYVLEYPQVQAPLPNGSNSYIDLQDFEHGIHERPLVLPSDLIGAGEELHVCIEDVDERLTLACYKPENAGTMGQKNVIFNITSFP